MLRLQPPVSTLPARAALKPLDAALDELLGHATALPEAELVSLPVPSVV